jgi:hypothetical protein
VSWVALNDPIDPRAARGFIGGDKLDRGRRAPIAINARAQVRPDFIVSADESRQILANVCSRRGMITIGIGEDE